MEGKSSAQHSLFWQRALGYRRCFSAVPFIAGVMLASSLEYTGTENALISTNSGEEATHCYFIFPNPLARSLFQVTLSCSVHNYVFWLPE